MYVCMIMYVVNQCMYVRMYVCMYADIHSYILTLHYKYKYNHN